MRRLTTASIDEGQTSMSLPDKDREKTYLEIYKAQKKAIEEDSAKIFSDVEPPPGAIDIPHFPAK